MPAKLLCLSGGNYWYCDTRVIFTVVMSCHVTLNWQKIICIHHFTYHWCCLSMMSQLWNIEIELHFIQMTPVSCVTLKHWFKCFPSVTNCDNYPGQTNRGLSWLDVVLTQYLQYWPKNWWCTVSPSPYYLFASKDPTPAII